HRGFARDGKLGGVASNINCSSGMDYVMGSSTECRPHLQLNNMLFPPALQLGWIGQDWTDFA
ncbi:hypothetical protein, partial [Pseudomonas syringae]|uniref:hypothetical protein n=1 Tax=Pseudomonas syringae TaxID=317 RepID=UPI001F4742C1